MGGASSYDNCCGGSFNGRFDDYALVLLIVDAPQPSDESVGARINGFKIGQTIALNSLNTPRSFEPLLARQKMTSNHLLPDGYRFKAARRCWQVEIANDKRVQKAVLQMAANPDDRQLANAKLDVLDAVDAGVYAHRFNLAQLASSHGEQCPQVRVAIPVVCEVVSSGHPAMVPVGSLCTLAPYPCNEVTKFVLDGSEEFWEVPQAFFHYAAFSSGSKHFVCDIQGAEDDCGSVLLLDPCLLRDEQPTIAGLVNHMALDASRGASLSAAPSLARFEAMHPHCSQLCRSFDPQRQTARRSIGFCSATCGLGR
mmetsp:Transcript_58485/g.163089  ORF Transcript_58485/g.163089 Transcript_58485/m.163089 type:complete len:311 (+) Transcript_58485:25-957(+)